MKVQMETACVVREMWQSTRESRPLDWTFLFSVSFEAIPSLQGLVAPARLRTAD